jgi:hypothetical protein
MRKITFFLISLVSLAFTFCGGKEMDSTPDDSNSGPYYYNEFEEHNVNHLDKDSTGHR